MTTAKTRTKIITSFLDLLASHSWDEVTLAKIAEASDVKLSKLRETFDGKVAIIEAFTRQIDAEVLDAIDEDIAEELPRERLMDILLSRFDALAPYKAASTSLVSAARRDLCLAAQLNRVTLISMTWMLNAANIDTSGIDGAMRVQGTALVFARVMNVWLKDEEGMAKTMAALDRELRAGERNMRRLNSLSGVFSPLKRFNARRRASTVHSQDPVDAVMEESSSAS